MKFSFPKHCRLLVRRDFQRMRSSTLRFAGKSITIDARENPQAISRLGISVSKKYGKSHDRNRFKRLVREAYRLNRAFLPQGIDLHVRPGREAKDATSYSVAEDFKKFNSSVV